MRERDRDLLVGAAGLDDVSVLRECVLAERALQLRDGHRDLDQAGHRLRCLQPRLEVSLGQPERLLARADRVRIVLAGKPGHRRILTHYADGVTATLLDGKALGAKVREEVAASAADFGHVGLATVLVGDDPASQVYIDLKQKAATAAGMEARDIKLPADTSEEDVLAMIAALNGDDAIDGLLVQLPLPDHLDENRIIEAIAPEKDIDGIHPMNAGRLYLGRPALVPGTPLGIMRMLDEYEIPLEGARAVVIGRSAIVGKPMAHLLLQRNASVTICHSRTRDLASHTLAADVLVAAVGRTHLVSPDMVKVGSTVVDVGMNRVPDSKKLLGDVDPAAAERAAYITPVPGGVGPMTIAMVLQNTVTAAKLRRAAQALHPPETE